MKISGTIKQIGVVVLSIAVALAASCTQGTKSVKLRFKFVPGQKYEYRQVTKGLIKVFDSERDELITDEYVEVTMDIGLEVLRILEDSTAEILETKSYRKRLRDLKDTSSVDTVSGEVNFGDDILKYVKPSGSLVDMAFVSDSARGDLEYIKEFYRQAMPEFPANEIGQGHSWTQTTRVVLPSGPVDASTTYTITGFGRERGYDCVIIEYDGLSVIPLVAGHKSSSYTMIEGVDRIVSKGHTYYAYKEGAIVVARERWVFDSDRTLIKTEIDEQMEYNIGDTVRWNIGIEYDVDYQLINLTE